MIPNAFTVGNKIVYDRELALPEPFYKEPDDDDSLGGVVWETLQEALDWCGNYPTVFIPAVYGLCLTGTWETDVSPSVVNPSGYHKLLVKARVTGRYDNTDRA